MDESYGTYVDDEYYDNHDYDDNFDYDTHDDTDDNDTNANNVDNIKTLYVPWRHMINISIKLVMKGDHNVRPCIQYYKQIAPK